MPNTRQVQPGQNLEALVRATLSGGIAAAGVHNAQMNLEVAAQQGWPEDEQRDSHDNSDQANQPEKKRDSTQAKSGTIASILSAVDALDESSDEDDHHNTNREATEVSQVQDLLLKHVGDWTTERAIDAKELSINADIPDIPYKGRKYNGTLLHVASLDSQGSKLVKKLLSSRARVHEFATGAWEAVAAEVKVLPIHLAAAIGDMENLRALLDARADVNARSKHDGKDHYTALHDAIWFSHDEAVYYLLRNKADVNAKNIKLETPLHLAVKMHDLPIVRYLVREQANLEAQAQGGVTAVHLAMQFCPESLELVAQKSMSTLTRSALVGAEENLAYKTILGRDGKLKSSWQRALKNQAHCDSGFVGQIITLCGCSALAAATVLDGLAFEPIPEDSQYEAPKSATVSKKFFPTILRPDMKWPNPSPNADGQQHWKWMKELSNLSPEELQKPLTCDDDDTLVSVKVIGVRGLLCPEMLEAIADSNDEILIHSIVPFAVVTFCWMHWARNTASAKRVYRAVAVALMTCSVALKTDLAEAPLLLNQVFWNGFAAVVIFEVGDSCIVLAKLVQEVIKKPQLEMVRHNAYNFAELASNGVSFYLVWIGAQRGFDLCADPHLAAMTLLFRWLLLAWSLRTVDGVGQKLLPIILASFEPVIGVLLVAFFGFVAFFTAFLALGSQAEKVNVLGILINTMRLLLLSDGDGIDAVLRVFPGDEQAEDAEPQLIGVIFLAAAILMFVIVILNLLIAAYGAASLKDGEIVFRRQLARVCLNSWKRPSWPLGFKSLSLPKEKILTFYFAIILLGVLGWAVLFYFAKDHAGICAWPALALFAGDCVLNQKPWEGTDHSPENSYLWMCHQRQLEHQYHQRIERLDFHRDHHKKLIRRLDMRHRKLHRKMGQIMIEVREGMRDMPDKVREQLSKAHGKEETPSDEQSNLRDITSKKGSAAPSASEPAMEADGVDLYCPRCGNPYAADANFCSTCGNKRKEAVAQRSPIKATIVQVAQELVRQDTKALETQLLE